MSILSRLCFALGALCVQASAQVPAHRPPSAADLEALEEAVEEGRDRVVLKWTDEFLKAAPDKASYWAAAARAAENVGEAPRADLAAAEWLRLSPEDREARVFRLRQLRRRGKLAEIAALAAPWIAPKSPSPKDAPAFDLGAAAEAALALTDQGDDAKAQVLFEAIIAESQRVVVRDAGDLMGLVESYLFFGGRGVDEAEDVLAKIQKLAPGDAWPSLRLAMLYWDRKGLPGDAVEETKLALKARPNYADALRYQAAVYAEWHNAEGGRSKSAEALAWCLDVNPHHAEALCDHAHRLISDFLIPQGREKLRAAAASEPRNLRVAALSAAADYLDADVPSAERRFADILALDPTYGEARRILASLLNERRRWPEALTEVRKAAVIDPASHRIWDDIARYALFLAQTPEGEAALKKANEIDAYNRPWRRNMELVLDLMRRRYVALETERFLVRVSEKERPALKRFYGPFFDRSFDILSKKYSYVPDGAEESGGRVVVEMFDDMSDFSARTFGYVWPGFLGVCFGPLVTLNGPRALPAHVNSWARTFHHEFAHSITVGLAKGRMTRWLTEGLSTYEEFSFEPSWTRGMERELFDAWATNDLCLIGDFDSHFRGSRVNFAYFQAGLVAEHLVNAFGMPKIVALLRAYGEDLGTEAAFRTVLGTTPAEVDKTFFAAVGRRVGSFKMQPRFSPAQLARVESKRRDKAEDGETAIVLAWARYWNGKKADAEAALATALRLLPSDPRVGLLQARMALDSGRVEAAAELRGGLAVQGVTDYDLALGLARAAEKAGRDDDASALYREAIGAFPSDPGPENPAQGPAPRVAAAALLKKAGRVGEAMALVEEHLRHRSEALVLRKELIAWRLGRGEKAEARKLLDLHVLIDARDAAVHSDRGALQFDAAEFEGALVSADMAAELLVAKKDGVKERTTARLLAADALIALERTAEARERLQAAAAEVPEDSDVLSRLAKIDEVEAASRKAPKSGKDQR